MRDVEIEREAAQRRRQAAERYRPPTIHVLLVAESPPALLSRHFYFEDVDHHDGLFWDIVKAVTGGLMTDRREKPQYLAELMAMGVFLVDLKEDPADCTPLDQCVEALIVRCLALAPRKIIIIKPEVFDLAFLPLRNAGLPVVNRRIPFPGTGRQLQFASAFAAALEHHPPHSPEDLELP